MSRWRFIGVKVSLNLQDLYKLNFTELYKEMKQKLSDLSAHTFLLIDRIDTIKTFITPKFLFLFRMLPLYIPISDLKLWQQMLNDFIWDKKLHRIFWILWQTKCYYETANLTTITRLKDHERISDWIMIEMDFSSDMTGQDLIWQTNEQIPTWLWC